ncbi:MAG: hypothetical protein ACI4WU_04910 [Bacilli bacterium]
MIKEEFSICKKAIETFGEAIQKIMIIEECSELIVALEHMRYQEPHNVEEETADVEIMLRQAGIMYNVNLDELVNNKPIKIDPSRLSDLLIKSLGKLIQGITKDIRSKKSDVEFRVIEVYTLIRFLRAVLGDTEIDKIKQKKLKRLKGVVWGE